MKTYKGEMQALFSEYLQLIDQDFVRFLKALHFTL